MDETCYLRRGQRLSYSNNNTEKRKTVMVYVNEVNVSTALIQKQTT